MFAILIASQIYFSYVEVTEAVDNLKDIKDCWTKAAVDGLNPNTINI